MKLQRNSRFRALAIGAVAVAGSLTLAACGSDDNGSSGTPTNTASASGASSSAAAGGIACAGKGQLLGAGSTAQKNAIDVWSRNFTQSCPDVTVNYSGGGSGAGRTSFLAGKVTFAGSDAALKPEEITQSKSVCAGGQAIDLPLVSGPIGIAYHLEGVDNLVLDAKTLAGIFSSKIKKWNDSAIKALNPDAKLPSTAIQAFHRSDSSGSTANFTKYLKAAAGSAWSYEPGSDWAAPGGQSAKGSDGLAAQVKQTAGSISYFEVSYALAQSIPTASIDTGAATPVQATTANAAKAIATAEMVGKGSDLALQLDYATKEEGAYPISLVTYEIVCDKGNKADTLPALKAFLNYTVSSAGQQSVVSLGYVPLPADLAAKVKAEIAALA